jgi:tRNA threonylcarbamoyl adenosine modification protein YeaZ
MKMLPLLAVDTTTDWLVLGVVGEEGWWARRAHARRAHQEILFPELSSLLAEARLDIDDIRCVAVGIGPGSYTGMRIGITFAKTLGHAKDLPLVPVDSLETQALSVVVKRHNLADRGIFRALIILDARRARHYTAEYEFSIEHDVRAAEGPKNAAEQSAQQREEHGAWPRASQRTEQGRGQYGERPAADRGMNDASGLDPCSLARALSVRVVKEPQALTKEEAISVAQRFVCAIEEDTARGRENIGARMFIADERTQAVLPPDIAKHAEKPTFEAQALLALGYMQALSGSMVGWEAIKAAYLRPSYAEEGERHS